VNHIRVTRKLQEGRLWDGRPLCAEHVRQLEGGSPFDNLMEVKS
jgi:hypothetical protein